MKKPIVTIIVLLLAINFSFAQIVFENTYNYSASYTMLANSGNKIFLMDVDNSQCRIYNTDHSLWKTINLDVPANNYLYDIKYVSEGLFTNDNTLSLAYIYYYYDDVNQYYTYNAKIVTESGTELLSITGCQYIYVQNITDVGTKMTAYSYDYSILYYTVETSFYDLPGELVSNSSDNQFGHELNLENAYPNPASDFSIVPYKLPDGIAEGEIQILDLQGKIIKTYRVDNNFDHLRIDTGQFPQGTYLYRLVAGNFSSKANKLMIK